KIGQLKKLKPSLKVGVDGGVKLENAADCLKAGADFLAVGTGLYKTLNVPFTIKQFQKILAGNA
ncbi:ribulose-phosphate 3-epimerase, partial [Candidatus Uhrbacteria bacterium]|nr:ribulose-phosphate 3-epimerase [Candidatus Uhrbacteria bacterium]